MGLKPNALLVLGFPNSPVLGEKLEQEARIWQALGKPKMLLRPYAPDIAERKPTEWALECFTLLRRYASYGIEAELIPANEFQIEGMGEDWPRMVVWLTLFAFDLKMRSPDTRLHLPALSPMGNYREGLKYLADHDLAEWYDLVNIHAYTEAQLQDVLVAQGLFPGKDVVVTEVNSMAPSFYLPKLASMGVSESYWFVLKWVDPPEGSPNVDLLGSPYFEDFKAMGHFDAEGSPESPLSASSGILGLHSVEGGTMAFQVGPGIKKEMTQREEEPVEDEHYLGDREAYCASDKALYIYSKGANKVARIPFV